MSQLSLSAAVLEDFRGFDKVVAGRIIGAIKTFSSSTSQELRSNKGLHLERYKNSRDNRSRTIRLGRNHRGIVLDCGDDQTYLLMRVCTHDEADHWMANNEFRVNDATGAVEIVDVQAIEEQFGVATPPLNGAEGLFDHRRDRDFTRLGVDIEWIPNLRALRKEEELDPILKVVPETVAMAVILLLGQDTVEVLYAQIAGILEQDDQTVIGMAEAVRSPASSSNYFLVTDDDDLAEILTRPMAKWRTYLHHSQRSIAYESSFEGPALVTGGAGTGKTVVALHRAKALADALPEGSNKKILFTTFHPSLAEMIKRDLFLLGGEKLLDAVDVMPIGSLRAKALEGTPLHELTPIGDKEAYESWNQVVENSGTRFTAEALHSEWEHLILANNIASELEYVHFSPVEGEELPDSDSRKEIWRLVEEFECLIREKGEMSFFQLSNAASNHLTLNELFFYEHVVVDEAQDLHGSHWRLLRSVVPEGPNDMFIVGDSDQRIYDNRASLDVAGIKISDRSAHLWINYRTSIEIADWASSLLGERRITRIEGADQHEGSKYKSFMHGPEPTMKKTLSEHDLSSLLSMQIQKWIDQGVSPEDIVVASRSRRLHPSITSSLELSGIPHSIRTIAVLDNPGVQVSTMHTLKGHEFRCVALFGVGDEQVPAPWLLEEYAHNEENLSQFLDRECSLLYMAATRARDDLWVGWAGEPSNLLDPVLDKD
jgi:hypothetical protein